ncbi:hypothetical protein [Stigmatella aurantiaca]|uniref:Uncharacterized protein n=1 Tax=Stigmatella aurantiaca (strain DW4/3-1) TaxID=378806 RepID=Q08Y05_STIAD|nr:hypothetical protein [Stigmatella aurantiaca]ADO69961.1 uncharacterized protein STAUR_2157 [Stigmatella aurantiaca DW4/3-1]EAU65387.1 hypothetical protein STIAU_2189 [Stigmatella aurantiaca DW4/3-1]
MSRQPWAFLAVSLVLHGLILSGLLWWSPEEPVSRRAPAEPLWMDIREVAPEPPPPPVPAPAAKADAPRPPRRVAAPREAPPAVASAPPEGPEAVAASPPGRDVPLAADEPRRPFLVPPVAVSPVPVEKNEQERVAERVDTLLRGDQAAAQVSHGHVDAYFAELRQAMEQGVGGLIQEGELESLPPPAEEGGFVEDRPVPPPSADRIDVVERSSANTQAVKRDPFGLTPGGQIGRALMMPIFSTDLEAPDARLPLRAVIELRQVRSSKESSARLLKSSKNAAFDKHVLARVPDAVSQLPLPARRVGSSMEEVHSIWSFEGTAPPPTVVRLRLLRIF